MVSIITEYLHAIVAALRDVVWKSWNDDAANSCVGHGWVGA